MLRLSPDTATGATAMVDTAATVDTVVAMAATAMARGLLMPSPRLRLSPSPDTATGATAMVATMAVMAMAATATARGPLRPSPDTATGATAMAATAVAMASTAMVDTVVVMAATATARGPLMPSPDTATGATAMAAMVATAATAATAMVAVTTDKFAASALCSCQRVLNCSAALLEVEFVKNSSLRQFFQTKNTKMPNKDK